MREALERLSLGQSLTQEETRGLFSRMIRGDLDPVEIAALLIAWKCKSETPEEIAGAATALCEAALPFPGEGLELVDTCGTGGDGLGTVNVSTAAALVVAEAGLKVAKHGNRAISSRCGSADVLEACGVRIEATPEQSRQSLDTVGIGFLFAPLYHPGIGRVMPVRRKLGVRTMFNLLGPLVNPARPRWQVVGVYDPWLCEPMAQTLGMLGCERALVVHGSGLDEITVHDRTQAALWDRGQLSLLELEPESLGARRWPLAALEGGDSGQNSAWLRGLLGGHGLAAHAELVAVNAGALLWLAGKSGSRSEGTRDALEILASGAALRRLERWAELHHGT